MKGAARNDKRHLVGLGLPAELPTNATASLLYRLALAYFASMVETKSAGMEAGILSHYGKAIADYKGTGRMTLEDGRQIPCTFVAGQLATGDVLVFCEFEESVGDHPTGKSFEGTSDKGYWLTAELRADGKGIDWYPFLPDVPDCEKFWNAFCVWELKVEIPGHVTECKVVRFGLTNLKFFPQKRDKTGRDCLSLLLNGTEVSIVRLSNYYKIVEYLRIPGATDLTSEMIIDTPTASTEAPKEIAENLCYLFSVARSTKVQWIYFDLYNGNGDCFQRHHFSRRTKPHNSRPLVDLHGAGETEMFIQQSYNVYAEKRDSYHLERLITSYLEARSSDDNIERKGIKLAVTLEMLKAFYLEIPENQKTEFIVDKDTFKPLIQEIQTVVDEALKRHQINKCLRSVISDDLRILGLNRRSFRHVLEKLFKEINLDHPGDEMKLFIKCRNSLIHRGRFYCTTYNPKDDEIQPLPTIWDEYRFMTHFVDRIFLKLLGYAGPYLDWSLEQPVQREHV